MSRLTWLAAALATFSAPSAIAATPSWELGLGADYSTGRYGAASDTQIADLTAGVRVQIDRLRLEGVAPLVRVDGPGELINGVLVGTGASSRRSGIGDIGVTGAWLLARGEERRPAIEAAASAKLPTAGAGIGTGKADYGLAVNLYQPLTAKLSLFGALGYSWLTDSHVYDLRNGAAATAALTYRPRAQDEIGVSASWREPVAAGYSAQASLSPYWSRRLSPRMGFSTYLGVGLTSSSPKLGGGVALKFYR